MADTKKYVYITKETITNARDRVILELNNITDGEAQRALELAAEYNELDKIVKEEFGEVYLFFCSENAKKSNKAIDN